MILFLYLFLLNNLRVAEHSESNNFHRKYSRFNPLHSASVRGSPPRSYAPASCNFRVPIKYRPAAIMWAPQHTENSTGLLLLATSPNLYNDRTRISYTANSLYTTNRTPPFQTLFKHKLQRDVGCSMNTSVRLYLFYRFVFINP